MKTMCFLLGCCKMQLVSQYVACSPFLGDNTRFLVSGRRVSNLQASHDSVFAAVQNYSLLDSALAMFLRTIVDVARSEPVFSHLTGKTNFANEHKGTFVLPVAEIALPMCHNMVWLALSTERCLGQPIITYRGATRVRVCNKNSH